MSFALLGSIATGCVADLTSDDDDLYFTLPQIDCTNLDEWAQRTPYTAGTRVIDTGDVFEARINHTAFGIDWNPKNAASLWLAVATCGDGGGDNGGDDNGGNDNDDDGAPDAGVDVDNDQDPPPPAPDICQPNGQPGPLFDAAGAKNVGNGAGEQFIFGQCLSNADCGSGCCAGPCGICSGPAVGDVPPKTGCGFPFN